MTATALATRGLSKASGSLPVAQDDGRLLPGTFVPFERPEPQALVNESPRATYEVGRGGEYRVKIGPN